MTPEAAVEEARAAYVAFLERTLAELRQSEDQASPELLVRLNADPSVCLKRLMRIDVVTGTTESPRLFEARTDTPTSVNLTLSVDTLTVHIDSLLWHECGFSTSPSLTDEALEPWFDHWMDQAELRSASADQLAGVIHSVCRSTDESFTVDFGSAPVAAFWELLAALQAASVRHVQVAAPPSAT